MTIKAQILDVLNSGPKKLIELVTILEEYSPSNRRSKNGIHPVKSVVLSLLNQRVIELTKDRYLRLL